MFCTYKQEVLDISKVEEDKFTIETDYSQNVNELVMKAFIKILSFEFEDSFQSSYCSVVIIASQSFLVLVSYVPLKKYILTIFFSLSFFTAPKH